MTSASSSSFRRRRGVVVTTAPAPGAPRYPSRGSSTVRAVWHPRQVTCARPPGAGTTKCGPGSSHVGHGAARSGAHQAPLRRTAGPGAGGGWRIGAPEAVGRARNLGPVTRRTAPVTRSARAPRVGSRHAASDRDSRAAHPAARSSAACTAVATSASSRTRTEIPRFGPALPACDCADAHYRPQFACKHTIAARAAAGDVAILAALAALADFAPAVGRVA